MTDFDIIAREVSGYRTRLEAIEKRLGEVEKVNARLEDAALTTARALAEISGHWEAVYEAMRRKDDGFGARSRTVSRQPDPANPEHQRADRVCSPYGRESLVLEAGSHEESIRIAADDFVRIAGAQPADICEDYPATSS